MAIYNTASDGSNTSVRAFLTKVGEHYLGYGYNTGSGKGKRIWEEIKNEIFSGCCVYCGEQSQKLTIEHLIMFNRSEFGLHHPGNTVPCCKECNRRRKDPNGNYFTWEPHLQAVCEERGEASLFSKRKERIHAHHCSGKYAYPQLRDVEVSSIKVICQSLYENIKTEVEKSLNLYKDLDREFIEKLKSEPVD